MPKCWRILPHDRALVESVERSAGVSAIAARLLAARGLTDATAVQSFLGGTMADLRDPDLLPGIPAAAEIMQIERDLRLAALTGGRLHIPCVTTAESLRAIREAKARGINVTCDTAAHYFALNELAVGDYRTFSKVAPPLRTEDDRRAVVAALKDGTIDMIATDHAPHVPEEKTRPAIWDCDCGFPGVETQMSLMLTEVNAGRMSISDYVRWTSYNPARAWGLFPRKGILRAGADADIVLVDLRRSSMICDADLQSRAKITPWNGRAVRGVPVHTLVRGRFVVRDRKLIENTKGWGQSVHAIQEMPPAKPRNLDQTTAAIVRPPLAAQ